MTFVHLYDKSRPKGGVTLCYTIQNLDGGSVLSLGASFCRPEEMYWRQMGKRISEKRLHSQPLQFFAAWQGDIKTRNVISILHSYLLQDWSDHEGYKSPLRPSRFKMRRWKDMIGIDGSTLRAEIDTHSFEDFGWASRIPRWAATFLADPP